MRVSEAAALIKETPESLFVFDNYSPSINHIQDSSPNLDIVSSVNNLDFLQDVEAEGASLVTQLRANSSIPYGIIPTIVQSYNNMAGSLSCYYKEEFNKSLLLAGIGRAVIDQILQKMQLKLELCNNPLDFLSTRYPLIFILQGNLL